MRSLVWFRNDLRVHDHPALSAAMDAGPTVACYVVSAAQWREHGMGDRRMSFQLRALDDLKARLDALNVPLRILDVPMFADAPESIAGLCTAFDVSDIHWIDEYPINERRRDDAVAALLADRGIGVHRHVGDVVIEPGALLTTEDKPYEVFTPFYRKWYPRAIDLRPLDVPRAQGGLQVKSSALPRSIDGVGRTLLADLWPGGEGEARDRIRAFVDSGLGAYPDSRDIPGEEGTSRLSAYLAIGAISPRECVSLARQAADAESAAGDGADKWISEIAWRDFYRHIVAQYDRVSFGRAFKSGMDDLAWRDAPAELEAWREGRTGYPLVDAGMRQLAAEGWMHNRVRMVVAMFLTKHLLIDWHEGESHFMERLVDGDFASNNGGWQWSASTGTDAAPYFRIFNPTAQQNRYDGDGAYVRRWVPELSDGDASYPDPIVDHKAARERALAFFKSNG